MVALLYGAGLRQGDFLDLRVRDIDVERSQILVRAGKGHVDRVTILPDLVREDLAIHLDNVRCLQRAGAQAARAASILRPVSPHTLRHSFATHLLEAGVASAPFRFCLGTRTCRPPWAIPI